MGRALKTNIRPEVEVPRVSAGTAHRFATTVRVHGVHVERQFGTHTRACSVETFGDAAGVGVTLLYGKSRPLRRLSDRLWETVAPETATGRREAATATPVTSNDARASTDTQERLAELLQWERLYAWAQQHESSSWAKRYVGYPEDGDYLGKSGSPLTSPLACYLNEAWPSSAFSSEWRIDRPTLQAWHSSDPSPCYPPSNYYTLPDWVVLAERLTDAIQGRHRGRGRRPAFIPAWITQRQFLAILEQVKPASVPLAPGSPA